MILIWRIMNVKLYRIRILTCVRRIKNVEIYQSMCMNILNITGNGLNKDTKIMIIDEFSLKIQI